MLTCRQNVSFLINIAKIRFPVAHYSFPLSSVLYPLCKVAAPHHGCIVNLMDCQGFSHTKTSRIVAAPFSSRTDEMRREEAPVICHPPSIHYGDAGLAKLRNNWPSV